MSLFLYKFMVLGRVEYSTMALTETIFLGDLQIKMVSLVILSVYFYQ